MNIVNGSTFVICTLSIIAFLVVNWTLIALARAARNGQAQQPKSSEWRGGHSGFRIINNDVEGK